MTVLSKCVEKENHIWRMNESHTPPEMATLFVLIAMMIINVSAQMNIYDCVIKNAHSCLYTHVDLLWEM